jgi:hypothetical protein
MPKPKSRNVGFYFHVPADSAATVNLGGYQVPQGVIADGVVDDTVAVRMKLEAEHGAYAVDEIWIRRLPGTPGLNSTRIRDEVPVQDLVDSAIALLHAHQTGQTDAAMAMVDVPPAPRRRWAVTDEHLQKVADVYRGAEKAPTEAVAAHFQGVAHRTATRWVSEARKRGFLPPTTRGKGTQR